MARLPKRLSTTELAIASADLYTASANTWTQICSCTASNKTGTPRYVTVTITPSGGTARNVVYQVVIPPNAQANLAAALVGQVLNPGDKISALAEAATAIDLSLSGFETVPA